MPALDVDATPHLLHLARFASNTSTARSEWYTCTVRALRYSMHRTSRRRRSACLAGSGSAFASRAASSASASTASPWPTFTSTAYERRCESVEADSTCHVAAVPGSARRKSSVHARKDVKEVVSDEVYQPSIMLYPAQRGREEEAAGRTCHVDCWCPPRFNPLAPWLLGRVRDDDANAESAQETRTLPVNLCSRQRLSQPWPDGGAHGRTRARRRSSRGASGRTCAPPPTSSVVAQRFSTELMKNCASRAR
jgi:hypothetical protein